jgi:SnoaL-like protein
MSPAMTPELEAMVRELYDKQKIWEVVQRYARSNDRRDRDMFVGCYHPDALDDRAMFTGGGEDLFDWSDPSHLRYYRTHQHYMCNHYCELDGDTAHAETYWIFAGLTVEGDQLTLFGGRYADRFEKRGGEWKIAARKTVMEWWGTPADGSVTQETIDAFAAVGKIGKDRSDLTYDRPLTIDPERVGLRGWI